MSMRQDQSAAALAIAMTVATPLTGCGARDATGRSSDNQATDLGGAALFGRCRGGPVTTVTDPQGDSVAQTAIGDDGRRVPPQRSMPVRGAIETRAVDLDHAAVQVSAGVMCLTFSSADPAETATYILRLANNRPSRPAIPHVLEIVPSTRGVLWHPEGSAEAEEAVLAYAYRRRGSTIRVALRVNDAFPQGIRTAGMSFSDFRWRIQSSSHPVVIDHVVRVAVDCVPNRAWTSYPTGALVGSPPLAPGIRSLRCPASG
jgi:hypothetical protein